MLDPGYVRSLFTAEEWEQIQKKRERRWEMVARDTELAEQQLREMERRWDAERKESDRKLRETHGPTFVERRRRKVGLRLRGEITSVPLLQSTPDKMTLEELVHKVRDKPCLPGEAAVRLFVGDVPVAGCDQLDDDDCVEVEVIPPTTSPATAPSPSPRDRSPSPVPSQSPSDSSSVSPRHRTPSGELLLRSDTSQPSPPTNTSSPSSTSSTSSTTDGTAKEAHSSHDKATTITEPELPSPPPPQPQQQHQPTSSSWWWNWDYFVSCCCCCCCPWRREAKCSSRPPQLTDQTAWRGGRREGFVCVDPRQPLPGGHAANCVSRQRRRRKGAG
ncbi:unnamed protein product [Vitrella brassicaformis CCMP3155]|uniref:Ubiquitin-like domain-containing protein n=1 Tax=Vitrella brassicaformis (strain CCMP3155) TaxID=1169540 RepID=A0A0G4EK00_VITBC|nr:unnamed protein product [Vitrella brassicaformis CCMP3155]|eukprot:CEL96840.1 unnamed protein product [Vitrella brassicaformis CCMP3155]